MDSEDTAFQTEADSHDLLNRDDKRRFQKLFTAQAVRSLLFLSFGMGVIALSLPILLVIAGGYDGHYSISFFYRVSDLCRNILVGSLCATGAFLFLRFPFGRDEHEARVARLSAE